jgi:hypothetical protein
LMHALISTLHHFFGGFPPSVRQRHRPPRPSEDRVFAPESCLRRGHDVSLSPQSETTDWVVAA